MHQSWRQGCEEQSCWESWFYAFLFSAPADPVVSVTGGQIKGRLLQAGAAFKGIPYAAPPVGDLRWREPAPIKPWNGVRDAGEYCATCSQIDAGWNKNSAVLGKEDCLFLNIWTPEWPAKSKRAVMFWILNCTAPQQENE
jgi:para-nitrobenzyl esterase